MPVFGLFGGKKRGKAGRPKGPRRMATPEEMAQRAAVDEVTNNPYARKLVAYKTLGIEQPDDIIETEKQIIAQGLRSNPEAQREVFDEWRKSKRENRERDGHGEGDDDSYGYGRYGGYESGPTQQMAEMIEFTRGMKQLTKEMGGGRSGGFDIGETIGSLAQALPMVLQLMASKGPQMMPPDEGQDQQNGHRSVREMMPEPAPGNGAPRNDPSLPSVDEIPGLGPGAAVPPEEPQTLPAVMDEPVTPPSPPEQEAPESDPHVQMVWQYVNGCLAESNPMLSMGAVALIQMLSTFPTPQAYQVFLQYSQMPGLKPYFEQVVADEQHCYAVIVTLRRLCQMMTPSEEVPSSA